MKALEQVSIFYEGKIPTLNNMYSQGRSGKRFISQTHKNFKKALYLIAMSQNNNNIRKVYFDKKLHVKIQVNFQRRGRDIDNTLKPILDALRGVIFKDDSQVYKITILKTEIKDMKECLQIEAEKFDGIDL